MNILVVHGPNLNLLGERPGDEPGRTLDDLNALLCARAQAFGVELRTFQSNHEGEIVDKLHADRRWADAVILSPGALAHASYVLREAVAAIRRPCIEVHPSDLGRKESWRKKSVLKDVCEDQIIGRGFEAYVLALERLAGRNGARGRPTPVASLPPQAQVEKSVASPRKAAEKTIGRRQAADAEKPGKVEKSLGRALKRRADPSLLTRALVRQKIADRLAGKLSPGALAAWARSQYLDVQRGAPAESGQRELLEDCLQALALSSFGASKLSDEQLIELLVQLDG